eukprot:m.165885 g.165885  ORF g.165885 m.165885 type:complete len:63 (+) comp17744_c0_seq2:229-417(+)
MSRATDCLCRLQRHTVWPCVASVWCRNQTKALGMFETSAVIQVPVAMPHDRAVCSKRSRAAW